MQDKHAKELETRTEVERKQMTEQFDKLTTMLKNMAEEEQVCFTLIVFPWIRCKSYILMSYFALFQTAMKLYHRINTIFSAVSQHLSSSSACEMLVI
jgi:hypothetical protein